MTPTKHTVGLWCRRLLTIAVVALLLPVGPARAQSDVPAVAAASDLRFALDEIAAQFRRESGRAVKLSYGSSGTYSAQIRQGAPFELFLSADERFVFQLHDAGRAQDRGVLYAVGRIVLFAPSASGWQADAEFRGLKSAIAASAIRRFAIANPEHAPYGRAAEQALRNTGLWDALRPHLVYGENVSQAAQFAASGSTQGGIFAYSLALATGFKTNGNYVLIPETSHEPLRQRMVLMKGAGGSARAFYDYLQRPAARAVFDRYGFSRPER